MVRLSETRPGRSDVTFYVHFLYGCNGDVVFTARYELDLYVWLRLVLVFVIFYKQIILYWPSSYKFKVQWLSVHTPTLPHHPPTRFFFVALPYSVLWGSQDEGGQRFVCKPGGDTGCEVLCISDRIDCNICCRLQSRCAPNTAEIASPSCFINSIPLQRPN